MLLFTSGSNTFEFSGKVHVHSVFIMMFLKVHSTYLKLLNSHNIILMYTTKNVN